MSVGDVLEVGGPIDMTWKIALPMAASAAVMAAVSLTAAPAPAKSPLEPGKTSARSQCFWTRQVNGFAAADDRIVNVRVGASDIYQFEMLGRCEDVDWNNHIALVSRGSGHICAGIDAEIVSPTPIGPRRCAVKTIRKLTPEEIKALPRRGRP